MAKYKAAIIGCGVRAHGHAVAYREVHNAKLVACANLHDRKRLNEFANTYMINPYQNVEDMIRTEKPDLVHIVTLPDQWISLTRLISELNVPACLMEKPVATGVVDYNILRDLEEKSTTKFGVNMQFRWHPNLILCRSAIQRIGKIQLIDFSCGMNISQQGVHILDWAMSLNGDSPIVRVFGNAAGALPLTSDYPAPESTACHVLFENGVHGLWNTGETAQRSIADSNQFGNYDDMIDNFDEVEVVEDDTYKYCRVAVYGDSGSVVFEEFGTTRIHIRHESGEEFYADTATPETWNTHNNSAQTAITDAMFKWLQDGNPVKTSLKNALAQWNGVLGVYESAITNKPVEIPFTPNITLMSKLKSNLSAASTNPKFGVFAHQSP